MLNLIDLLCVQPQKQFYSSPQEIIKRPSEIHAADLLKYYAQSISPGTIALAGRALGITVKNYKRTKISMFDRSQKEALRDWKDAEANTGVGEGGDE